MRAVVCTLGMHRSGTSLVSRVLNLLGVELGPSESMLGPAPDNPKGHWEHHEITVINDEILAAFGGSWHEPPQFPDGWVDDPRLAEIRERALQMLARDFGDAPLWGWKDPRTCLTLLFWQRVVGAMRYVICVRHPLAVMASMLERNGMGVEKVDPMWHTYMRASLDHTGGAPRLFVFYEDLLDDSSREVRRMSAFIGHPERGDDTCIRAEIESFLEPDLCHHRSSIDDLAAHARISQETRDLYVKLRHCRGEC